MQVSSWVVEQAKQDMVLKARELEAGPGEVIVEVAGCGVCHTDLGFFYDGVPTRQSFPLTLGHEVSGRVVEAGEGAEGWLEAAVIVPAVIPCGSCNACRTGHGRICPEQVFPGSDVHGGFGSHLLVPARGLCRVPALPEGLKLAHLSVVADAITTPYQAIAVSGLAPGELAVFIGVGGVGGFGVQIARAIGARVIALDTSEERLALLAKHGAELCLNPKELDFRAIKKAVQGFAGRAGIPSWRQRIFECSGSAAGQQTAFGLLGRGGSLGIVGFTRDKLELRLSNLMAFDATCRGTWGCLPELYPPALELVLRGDVVLAPFVDERPLSTINESFAALHEHRVRGRLILCPET